jgi:hypothetical protein
MRAGAAVSGKSGASEHNRTRTPAMENVREFEGEAVLAEDRFTVLPMRWPGKSELL